MARLQDIAHQANTWACYDCGKCTSSCPVSRAGADYSPRRHVLNANSGDEGEILADDTLFSCLTCMQCDTRCPAEVDYTWLVLQLRALRRDRGEIEHECPHGGALQSVMRMMASGGMTQNRLEWLEEGLETSPDEGKVFFFTGCATYLDAFFTEFDMHAAEGLKASVKIFNALGQRPVVSGEERCCGHDLLWNGDRENFEKLARHNIAMVEASGAETLVTSCAECLRTWKVDYEPYFEGPKPQMLHLSEFVAERMPELEFGEGSPTTVTYQDPCRLCRHLDIVDQPREVLAAVPGLDLVEMPRHGSRALCCSGATFSSCDRFAKRIQVDRLEEARATGAEVMVTACPKCQVHFRCAMNDPKRGEDLNVDMRDIAEVLAEALTRSET